MGGMHRLVAEGGGRILHQGDVIAELGGKSAGRLDARIGDHANNDHVAYAELLQLQVQIGVGEPTGVPVLVDDDVIGLRLEVVVERAAPCPLAKICRSAPASW